MILLRSMTSSSAMDGPCVADAVVANEEPELGPEALAAADEAGFDAASAEVEEAD
jgi:hypothetical protein